MATLDYARTVLTWQSNPDTAPGGFDIHGRTSETAPWTPIGTTENSTASGSTFQFVAEEVPTSADTVRYRLQQATPNGYVYHSQSVAVELEQTEPLSLENLFPNPVQEDVTVRYGIPSQMANVTLELLDVLRRKNTES